MWANFLKNTFEWIEWVNLIVEDLFILEPYEKLNSFQGFLRVLAGDLRTHLAIYFRNVFYMTKKLVFAICLLLNLSIVKRIFYVPMFQLYMWQKSLTNICEGFHLCKVEKNIYEKLRDFRPAFLKESFSLYVTGAVPVRHFH